MTRFEKFFIFSMLVYSLVIVIWFLALLRSVQDQQAILKELKELELKPYKIEMRIVK